MKSTWIKKVLFVICLSVIFVLFGCEKENPSKQDDSKGSSEFSSSILREHSSISPLGNPSDYLVMEEGTT